MRELWVSSKLATITNRSEIAQAIQAFIAEVLRKIEELKPQDGNSGLVFDKLIEIRVNHGKYQPVRGASYIELPSWIKGKQACLNVKNEDEKCFMWSILSALHPIDGKKHPELVCKYSEFANELDFTGIDFPVKISDVAKFERQNNISVNVFVPAGAEKNVNPLHISKLRSDRMVDLLLIQGQGGKNHYVWIKNLGRLVRGLVNSHGGTQHICRYCLTVFYEKSQLDGHVPNCSVHSPARPVLPTVEKAVMKFANEHKMEKVPFAIYADFESLTLPVQEKQGHTIEIYQRHEPCGYAFKVVSHVDGYESSFKLYRGHGTVPHFLNALIDEKQSIIEFMKSTQENFDERKFFIPAR